MRPSAAVAGLALLVAACGGGDGGSPGQPPAGAPAPQPPAPGPARLFADPAPEFLSEEDVRRIVAQAAGEALARNLPVVIAVTDRVGNVLGVFRMAGARPTARLRDGPAGNFDAQGVDVPAEAAAIAKAITGAYLSSAGNAFSTRTASMIVQEHFPPSALSRGLEAGPLFGVQFSQLPCSDVAARFPAGGIGPKRSPLGLAADPGGFPLYKNGVVVGGIGVMGDGDYGFDPEVRDIDEDDEELIALAGTTGFAAPRDIEADRVSVDGTTLRFRDRGTEALRSNPAAPPAFAGLAGGLVAVPGYSDGVLRAGTAYGSEASGIRRARADESANADHYVLTDGTGLRRFEPSAAGEGGMTANEVRLLLDSAFDVMARARAQIRRPLESRAQVSIAVVDSNGRVLGLVRSPDAPIFGIDVAVQKARSAMFLSSAAAAPDLLAHPNPAVVQVVGGTRSFLADAQALSGRTAISARAIGNLARPFFPDGELGRPPGPFGRDIATFSPFANGLQSALIIGDIAAHLGFLLGANPDPPPGCGGLPAADQGRGRLANGLQIFPGGVPLYRNGVLVGGIGISGDGIDQDDMIAFLGADGIAGATAIRNAAPDIRSDRVEVPLSDGRRVRLRYIVCPFAPFLGDASQNVCAGR
ncbi:MAG: heme-binding protein [Thermaurantiacus sp.]